MRHTVRNQQATRGKCARGGVADGRTTVGGWEIDYPVTTGARKETARFPVETVPALGTFTDTTQLLPPPPCDGHAQK